MSGWRLERRKANLTFEPPFDGVVIEARLDVPTKTFLALDRFQAVLKDEDPTETLRAALGFFVEHVALGWNVQDEDGVPLPLTVESMFELPIGLVSAIIPAWKEAAVGVPAPLVDASSSGDTSDPEPSTTPASS